MTFREVYEMLTETGLPVAYRAFKVGAVPPLPYIVYQFNASDNFGADNTVYKRVDNLQVWLCSKEKDFALEESFESVLSKYGVYWEKTEDYVESADTWMILYESEIVINA